MSLKTYRVSEVLDSLYGEDAAAMQLLFDNNVFYSYTEQTEDGNTQNHMFLSGSNARYFLRDLYDWSFLSIGKYAHPVAAFCGLFQQWYGTVDYELDRMSEAWLAKYDPIENFNRNTDLSTERTHDGYRIEHDNAEKTDTYGELTESTTDSNGSSVTTPMGMTRTILQSDQNGKKVNIAGGNATMADGTNVTTETKVTTFDAAEKPTQTVSQNGDTAHNYQESVTYQQEIRSNSMSHTQTTPEHDITYGAHKDTDSYYGAYKDTTKGLEHGNIGVTTNQQMIEAENRLREQNFAKRIFNMFARDNLFLNCYERSVDNDGCFI